ncbi:MAG TPA: hypothetical protein V6C99_06905 [Oculatellaceae cyanobacterium]|jgi:hypothetical protein
MTSHPSETSDVSQEAETLSFLTRIIRFLKAVPQFVRLVVVKNLASIRAYPWQALLALLACLGATCICRYFGTLTLVCCLAYGVHLQNEKEKS